jgi:hypothetical protein
MAFERLSSASSFVFPWPFAPGISGFSDPDVKPASVVVTRLEEVDAAAAHEIDDAVFLGEPP